MIGYTTVGTNNIQQATAFYEALFSMLGVNKLYDAGVFVAWGQNQEQPMFCLTQPYDGKPATVGNGTMIALRASSPEAVDSLHKKALELGAKNEGDPGMRQGGYYCAYFRDLDGNKLNFYYFAG